MSTVIKPPELDKKTLKYIKSALRRIWQWSPERRRALNRAQVSLTTWYCEECGAQPLSRKERDVDHITSVENVGVDDGLFAWISRLFVRADGYQILCKQCHRKKTTRQSNERRKLRKETSK
jgi:5-methylcytosine-specific restriction endonuclease McrA